MDTVDGFEPCSVCGATPTAVEVIDHPENVHRCYDHLGPCELGPHIYVTERYIFHNSADISVGKDGEILTETIIPSPGEGGKVWILPSNWDEASSEDLLGGEGVS